MIGTLIGVFITTAAVVVGADSAVWGPGVPPGLVVDKTCRTGPRSVATLQGSLGFSHPWGEQSDLLNLFRTECNRLRDLPTPVTLKGQADALIEKLRSDLAAFLSRVPPTHFVPPFGPDDPQVAYISVAGYQESMPVVAVNKLGVLKPQDQWQALARDVPGLSFTGCGARFHGEDKVAYPLLWDDPRLPAEERNRPEVIAARHANSGRCSRFTPEIAKTLFITAVRLTIRIGDRFGVPQDRVGGPLKLIVIPPAGEIREEIVTKY